MTQAEHGRLRKAIREEAAARGWLAESNGPVQTAGRPDLTLCIDGRYVGVECKTGDGKLTPAQHRYAEQIRAAGGLFIEARSREQFLEETMPSIDAWFQLGMNAVQAINNLADAIKGFEGPVGSSAPRPVMAIPDDEVPPVILSDPMDDEDEPTPKRRGGRPKGSKNKVKAEEGVPESLDEVVGVAAGVEPEGDDIDISKMIEDLDLDSL